MQGVSNRLQGGIIRTIKGASGNQAAKRFTLEVATKLFSSIKHPQYDVSAKKIE